MSEDLRDGFGPLLNDRRERQRLHRAIRDVERRTLGLPPIDYAAIRAKEEARRHRLGAMAEPKEASSVKHTNFLQGPRSRRGKGESSADAMFQIDPKDREDGVTSFWLYGTLKLTQSTLKNTLSTALALGGIPLPSNQKAGQPAADGRPEHTIMMSSSGSGVTGSRPGTTPARSRAARSSASSAKRGQQQGAFLTALDEADDDHGPGGDQEEVSDDDTRAIVFSEFVNSHLAAALRRRLDTMMATAASRRRCGLLFDLVSTANIIRSGVPHLVGEYIYDYLATQHNDKLSVKFTFVGITDNVNCCAARDVLCRDDRLNGQYVGATKRREFDALDNIHVYAVFPRHGHAPAHMTAMGLAGVGVGGASTAASPTTGGKVRFGASGNASGPSPALSDRAKHLMASVAKASKVATTPRQPPPSEKLAELAYDTDDDDPDHVTLEERPKKVPLDVKKRIFDRREWSVFSSSTAGAAAAGGSSGPGGGGRRFSAGGNASMTSAPPRAASATPGFRPGGGSSAAKRQTQSRSEAMGLGRLDFPPGLAEALRAASSMQ